MKWSWVSIFVIAAIQFIPIKALASPLVQTISQAQAQGLTGDGATVMVWSGSGTNLDFTQTGEKIQRAWLDDPSKITIDFDTPLCSGSSEGSCSKAGASVVHLRRIVGVQFPTLPSTATTLLTIVTQASSGQKVYLFKVAIGQGHPNYASIAIMPGQQQVSETGVLLANGKTANWSDVDRGLSRAIQRGLIQSNSPVVKRVQECLALIHNGTALKDAIAQAHLSLALITKLAEMGYSFT